MNAELLEKAVKYHGKVLFDLILKQNNCDSNIESEAPPEPSRLDLVM